MDCFWSSLTLKTEIACLCLYSDLDADDDGATKAEPAEPMVVDETNTAEKRPASPDTSANKRLR